MIVCFKPVKNTATDIPVQDQIVGFRLNSERCLPEPQETQVPDASASPSGESQNPKYLRDRRQKDTLDFRAGWFHGRIRLSGLLFYMKIS